MSSLSRSSRSLPRILRVQTRSYADPRIDHNAAPSDSRMDVIRSALYPPDAYKNHSASPSGNYHPDHLARINAVIHSPEVYETIDRAWRLYQRQIREARKRSLEARYDSMVEACDELDRITNEENGVYPRSLYDAAMTRPNPHKLEMVRGRAATAESRWREARLAGYFPREAWVPTETRGKGWNYEWKRPTS
ncbi:hypothetical protein BCR39DRAFT_270361 [Naematelia encephala]|uniref:Uncharacterized protein n=1 Tax=Naematelia encephala TaxID=71784 RepID=A0A1Y2AUB5_9TREE|nr:hypothetical protein BCR39DRAFT_270361 [Naematelia encephala]